jgi:serine/threonine-protein kinase
VDSSPGSEAADLAALQPDPALQQRGLVLVDVLGVGGNSIVYRARDPRHGRDVAVKVLRTDAVSETADARFEREVRVAGGLRHPHILPLFDSGVLEDGRRFAVMPVAQGRPLRAMIDEGPLTVPDAVRLAREVGEALVHLHGRGWIHRDVKPENILVENGHAVLTDFGIATPIDTPDRPQASSNAPVRVDSVLGSRLTEFGKVIGTRAYMSPEAMVIDAHLDGRTDVFALGLVLYEMLAGRLPSDRYHDARADTPRRPVDSLIPLRPDVPIELDALVLRATQPDLNVRLASMREFTETLGHVAATDRPVRLRMPVREGGGWMLVVGLATALAAGVAAVAWRHATLPEPGRVVVADFKNETGLPALDRVGELAGDIVVAQLSRAPGLTVINAVVALGARQRSPAPSADSLLTDAMLALVRETRAGVVITGSYYSEGTRLDVLAEVTDTRSGRILGVVGPLAVDTSQPERGLQAIADSVVGVVRHRYAPPVSGGS